MVFDFSLFANLVVFFHRPEFSPPGGFFLFFSNVIPIGHPCFRIFTPHGQNKDERSLLSTTKPIFFTSKSRASHAAAIRRHPTKRIKIIDKQGDAPTSPLPPDPNGRSGVCGVGGGRGAGAVCWQGYGRSENVAPRGLAKRRLFKYEVLLNICLPGIEPQATRRARCASLAGGARQD